MLRYDYSSDDLPGSERFDALRARVEQDMSLCMEAEPENRVRYSARLSFQIWPSHSRVLADSSPYHVTRGRREVAQTKNPDCYIIYRQRRESAWFRFENRELVTHANDLFVSDASVICQSIAETSTSFEYWRVPKHALEPHLPAGGRPLRLHLTPRPGVQTLAISLLASVDREIDSLPDAALGSTLDHVCRLIGVACGTAAGEQSPSIAAGHLARARRVIEIHLGNPRLSPAFVAGKLGIAVRTLHAAFEPSGESFAQFVMRLRLQACRDMFADPAHANRSVTDIALGWGFGSLPTFYRGFRRAFGTPPGELRDGKHRTVPD